MIEDDGLTHLLPYIQKIFTNYFSIYKQNKLGSFEKLSRGGYLTVVESEVANSYTFLYL